MLRISRVMVCIVALATLPAISRADTDFNITGIAPLAGDNFSTAYAINNNGEIIGVSYDANIQIASGTTPGSLTLLGGSGFFDTGTTPTVIPAIGANPKGLSIATPVALSDSGEIVGASTQSGASAQVGFIDVGGVVTNVSSLLDAVPVGVNDSGVLIADEVSTSSVVRYNGTVQTLIGRTSSTPIAFAINNSGVVAGESETSTSTTAAPNTRIVEWPANSATPTDLGGLSGFSVTVAFGINSAGDAVGYGFNPVGYTSTTKVNATDQNGSIVLGLPYSAISTGEGSEYFSGEAFLYSAKANKFTGLGDLGGGFSMAEAVNDSDEVVGMSLDSSGDYHAFLYDGSAMIDLNSLIPATSGWDLINADGINNAGDIVGYGDDDGLLEAFELTPGGTISGTGGNGGGSSSGSGGGSTGAAVPLPSALWAGMGVLMGLVGAKVARRSKCGMMNDE